MPAKSKAQQRAAGAALSAKFGKATVSNLQGTARDIYEPMSEHNEDFASTGHDVLPERVEGD